MFTHPGVVVISASLVAYLVTMIGIFVINKREEWGSTNVVYFMSFAAGVLIYVSFLHIIPQSFAMNKEAPVFLLAGFFALYLTCPVRYTGQSISAVKHLLLEGQ